jgi:hypothetical protein
MLLSTFNYGGRNFYDQNSVVMQANKDAYDRQKDVTLLGLSLLSAVLGYYLGRVPAEKHASEARKDAVQARIDLRDTTSKWEGTVEEKAKVEKDLAVADNARRVTQSKLQQAAPLVEHLLAHARAPKHTTLSGAAVVDGDLVQFDLLQLQRLLEPEIFQQREMKTEPNRKRSDI